VAGVAKRAVISSGVMMDEGRGMSCVGREKVVLLPAMKSKRYEEEHHVVMKATS
jgi:hypothetical protein